jgi:hypothetical protein
VGVVVGVPGRALSRGLPPEEPVMEWQAGSSAEAATAPNPLLTKPLLDIPPGGVVTEFAKLTASLSVLIVSASSL